MYHKKYYKDSPVYEVIEFGTNNCISSGYCKDQVIKQAYDYYTNSYEEEGQYGTFPVDVVLSTDTVDGEMQEEMTLIIVTGEA